MTVLTILLALVVIAVLAGALIRIRNAIPVLKTRSPNLVALAQQARFLTDIRPIVWHRRHTHQEGSS